MQKEQWQFCRDMHFTKSRPILKGAKTCYWSSIEVLLNKQTVSFSVIGGWFCQSSGCCKGGDVEGRERGQNWLHGFMMAKWKTR